MENLKCVGLQFNMFFDPYSEIRTQSNELEKDLKELFSDGFITLPNPGPTAPNEIPRILGNSHDTMYQLAISNVNASISKVKFGPDENIETVFDDFKLKTDAVFDAVMKILPVKKLTFCGITVSINISNLIDANEIMLKKFLNREPLSKLSSGLDIYDIGTKYTFTKDSKYFINLFFNTVRNNNDEKAGMAIQLDINDRYRYNVTKGSGNYSESNVKDVLYDMCLKMVKDHIVNLVEGD